MIAQVMASMANPPQTVSTVTAGLQDWQPQMEAVGSLRAVNGADLSLEVSGIVDQINFNSGDDVPAGAVLLRLRAGRRRGEVAGVAGDRGPRADHL